MFFMITDFISICIAALIGGYLLHKAELNNFFVMLAGAVILPLT